MAKIGHVHLKVRDLVLAESLYHHFLGFEVVERFGKTYSFLSSGDTHHDIALQHVGHGASLPEQDAVGLAHTAFEVSNKLAFAQSYLAFKDGGIPVQALDQRIAWVLSLRDPSGNGVQVYVDTRGEADGVAFWEGKDRPLNKSQILAALDNVDTLGKVPSHVGGYYKF